jgi:hypothetical protein
MKKSRLQFAVLKTHEAERKIRSGAKGQLNIDPGSCFTLWRIVIFIEFSCGAKGLA